MEALLTSEQVAEMLGVSHHTFRSWRKAGRAPLPVRISPKCLRWRPAEVERWIDQFSAQEATG